MAKESSATSIAPEKVRRPQKRISEEMADFWGDDTSVLFTSFYGWTPETWGTVGWTNFARRNNLLNVLTDPFITVCYVTGNKTFADPASQGKITGFYLVSHETGDRDQFTHPIHHTQWPEKWRHSLRAIRAFSYLPEYRLSVSQLDPALLNRARSVATMGELLTDAEQIELLRDTPWIEVDIYTPAAQAANVAEVFPDRGLVKPGPVNKGGYIVAESTHHLNWQLYVLRLVGDTDAYLGHFADGRSIFKIGLSVSPDLRRQAFEKAMPRGAFHWQVHRTTKLTSHDCFCSFDVAVTGEDAMKSYLTGRAKWLGGEFYLATEAQIDEAWQLGHAETKSLE